MEKIGWRTETPRINEAGLYLAGELVVARNEAPIQTALVKELARFTAGRVLELGYGLGFANQAVREQGCFSEHWVIEGNTHLALRCLEDSPSSVTVCDTWEHAAHWLPKRYFDAVIFDPYPFDAEASSLNNWKDKFTYVAKKANPMLSDITAFDGVIGFINFDPSHFDEQDIDNCFNSQFHVQSHRRVGTDQEEVWVLAIR